MVFTSIPFLFCFFPLFLIVYFLTKKRKTRNFILFLFSIIFYAWGEPLYIFLVLFSILINYYLTKKMVQKNSKKLFILTIVIDILILIFFKYIPFFTEITNTFLNTNIPIPNIKLPIGISFYTFQMLSYVIDVYKKKVKVQNNIIYLGCYIIAFPQLIAGPIVRYSTIEEELTNRCENTKDFKEGTERFIIGLAKKVLIANVLGLIVTNIFNEDAIIYGFCGSWLGIIFYALQILFDFSGYSDMAIGIGKMLGFHYLENFNYPYISKSITDFWRRWHISLSSFFKDYVYIPLGGNKVGIKRHILNLLIVWLLTGLWHGARINFVIWGLYYGIILIIEKYLLKKFLQKMPGVFQHLYAIFLILIGWVLFRSESFLEIITTFKALMGLKGLGNLTLFYYLNIFNISTLVALILAFVFCIPKIYLKLTKNKYLKLGLLISLFVISLMEIIVGSYNPFIYFRF